MQREPRRLPPDVILQELAKLFLLEAHDRQVYCVFGPYRTLKPFQQRIHDGATRGSFDNSLGKVRYLSLTRDLFSRLREAGKHDRAATLADRRRDEQLKGLLSETFRDLVTRTIEQRDTLGLFLADFELLYAYDLGDNDISITRQVAINGRRVCLLVPGAWHDGRLWIFDEDPETRRAFPDALLFANSGWVFEIAE
jgi:hypothetical protein